MKIITVDTSPSYNVLVGKDILKGCGSNIREITKAQKAMIISDSNVFPLYGDIVSKSLTDEGFIVENFCFEAGENSKTLKTVEDILEFMTSKKISHSDIIIALGGGIVGDVAGFCSAIYLRGIPFVQIPTTLLAAVDSSVGGKTGVNLSQGKNLAGAFNQPKLVLCDINTFDTLSEDIIKDGLCEVIKYGCILDKELFNRLLKGEFQKDIIDIIARCVKIKADVVKEDELDKGVRQILNFGHTIAHSIEALSDFKIPHGRAVAMGMVMIEKSNNPKNAQEIKEILDVYNIDINCEYSIKDLASKATGDKKVRGGKLNLILLNEIGSARIQAIELNEIENFFMKGNN